MSLDKLVDSTQLDADLTIVANAIRTKGGTSAQLSFPTDFVTAIGAIPTGGGGGEAPEKDVNFIDYDGTILYSYTATEANALTELPSNPSHTGLTAQGWNWTLQQIKDQLTYIPDGPVWVGQMYTTASGKTEIDIELESDRLNPYLLFAPNGTVVIDWGDGSNTNTVTGTSTTTVKYTGHTYAAAGKYTITLNVTSGKFKFYNSSSSYRGVLSYRSSYADDAIYSVLIKEIRVGPGANFGQYGLSMCFGLETISIPTTCGIDNYAFCHCRFLKCVVLPSGLSSLPTNVTETVYTMDRISYPYGTTTVGNNALRAHYTSKSITIPYGVTSLGEYALYSDFSLQKIFLPNTLTTINQYCFGYCESLTKIIIPTSVTSIKAYVFQYCIGITEYHFLSTSPPTIQSTTFSNTNTSKKIYVPSSAVATYKGANNWSSLASYIYGE